MRALLPLAVLLLLLNLPVAAVAADLDDFTEAGGPRWKRVKAAGKLTAAGDVVTLFDGVKTIATRAAKDDVELLASLALKEDNPLLRLAYARGLELIGPEKAVPELTTKIAKGSTFEKIRGIEALGFLRAETSIETLFTYAADRERMIATEAFRALARFLPRKESKRLAAVAVAVPNRHAGKRGAWAVVDVARNVGSAASAFKRLSRGKGEGVERAKALRSEVTGEGMDKAFRYPKTHLVGVEAWFKKGRDRIVVEGDALAKSRLRKALEFMKTKCPSYYQLVVRAFSKIASKSTLDDRVDWGSRTLIILPRIAGNPNFKPVDHASLFVRAAVRILMRDMGDVHRLRRGFEQAAKNVYWWWEGHSGLVTDSTLDEYIDRILKERKKEGWR